MIYLDSAATTLQKPRSVASAVSRAMESMASPGRGCHRAAMLAADCVYDCRVALASFFGVESPENVVFTFNATHALNIAINSLVSRGDCVAVSGYEHNSVVRPLKALGARINVVRAPLFKPEQMLDGFSHALKDASCAVCTHVSNAFGYILPIERLAEMCADRGVPLIIDASQSAGVLPLNFSELGAAFIAMPGHKSLLGPQGTGVLLCSRETKPLLFGGTGSNSAELSMPDYLPERLEAGTHNVPGIAGLLQGISFLSSRPAGSVLKHERSLKNLMLSRLSEVPGLKLYASENPAYQSGVFSIVPQNMAADELAERLGAMGICTRAGLHCAPVAHETVGTDGTGTVRISFSPFNTAAETVTAAEQIKKILNNIAK